MKEIIFRILIGAVTFLIIYLLGAFYNVSFDLSVWDEEGRAFIAVMGGSAFFCASLFPGYDFD